MTRIGPPTVEQFDRLRPALGQALVAAGFWSAVVLGLASLPLVMFGPARIDVVALLLTCNVLCLLVGHRHEPTADRVNGGRRTEKDGGQGVTTGVTTG